VACERVKPTYIWEENYD